MMHSSIAVSKVIPGRKDGTPIQFFTDPSTGFTYADTEAVRDYDGNVLHRSGPEHPKHYHRFCDYGLIEDIVRCKRCGLCARSSELNVIGAVGGV